MQFREHQIQIDSTPINYVKLGTGPVLLFLHNSGGCWQIWSSQLTYFSKYYTTLAFDWPGNGQSGTSEEPTSLSYYTQILQKIIQHFQWSKLTIIGNCIGASVALHYAQHHLQQVEQVLLFNICPGSRLGRSALGRWYIHLLKKRWAQQLSYPFLKWIIERTSYSKRFPAIFFAKGFSNNDPLYKYLKQLFDNYRGNPKRFYDLYQLSSFDLNHYYIKKLSIKTGLFWGENNQVTAYKKDGYYFEKQLDIKAQLVPGAGHLCMYEQAKTVNQLIHQSLNTLT